MAKAKKKLTAKQKAKIAQRTVRYSGVGGAARKAADREAARRKRDPRKTGPRSGPGVKPATKPPHPPIHGTLPPRSKGLGAGRPLPGGVLPPRVDIPAGMLDKIIKAKNTAQATAIIKQLQKRKTLPSGLAKMQGQKKSTQAKSAVRKKIVY